MKRGDVYWANLAPRSGSEQTGRRPVIILSHDAFNQTAGWRSIIVIPVSTSSSQAKRGPTVVSLAAGAAGLPSDCSAICHQITTLDRAKLADHIGQLPPELLAVIEKALLAAVDIRR
jgi:mRNA interferase MazF